MDLIAYFSISGNTKKVAEKLNSLVDADILNTIWSMYDLNTAAKETSTCDVFA